VVSFVHDKNGVEILDFPSLPPYLCDGLPRRQVPLDPDQEGIHQTTSRLLIVSEKSPDLAGLLQGESGQDLGSLFRLEFRYQVYCVIDFQLMKKLGALLRIQSGEDFPRIFLLVHLRQRFRGQLGREDPQEGHPIGFRIEGLDQVGYITRMQFREKVGDSVEIPGGHKCLELFSNAFDVLIAGSCQR
jgi:hypothetical protein